MSPYEQNILDMHSIYISHPQLFSPSVRDSLAEVLSELSEDDSTEHVSITVLRWCKSQPEIWDAFLNLPISNENEMGPNRTRMLSASKPLNILNEVISAPIKDAHDDSTSQTDSLPVPRRTNIKSSSDSLDSTARE